MLNILGVLFVSVAGTLLTFYIWARKRRGEKLICLLGDNCNEVVYSQYSVTLGIKNEVLGLAYYAFIAFAASVFLVMPERVDSWMQVGLLLVTGCAAAFSLYLTAIQGFVIRKWCEWCLISTLLSLLIFIFLL